MPLRYSDALRQSCNDEARPYHRPRWQLCCPSTLFTFTINNWSTDTDMLMSLMSEMPRQDLRNDSESKYRNFISMLSRLWITGEWKSRKAKRANFWRHDKQVRSCTLCLISDDSTNTTPEVKRRYKLEWWNDNTPRSKGSQYQQINVFVSGGISHNHWLIP